MLVDVQGEGRTAGGPPREGGEGVTAAAETGLRLRPQANVPRERKADVLVLDAAHRQSLECMREYARRGLRVDAAVAESEVRGAQAFASRWCHGRVVLPDLATSEDAFAERLIERLRERPVQVVLPAHDGTIAALRPRRAEIERLAALPLANEGALAIAVSKRRTLALAGELGLRIPESLHVRNTGDIGSGVAALGLPVVIKPVESWAATGVRLSAEIAQTAGEAVRRVEAMLAAGSDALLQPWLPGRREAISLFFAEGRMLARFAQASYREWPVLGGASVLCESVPLAPDVGQAAEALVRAIGLEGPSLVEFRRDRQGHPVLMEVNPRMAGSVALAVAAGVDFPWLTYRWALGMPLEPVRGYRTGRRLRWLVGDAWNLWYTLTHQGEPDTAPRRQALAGFAADFARRPADLRLAPGGDLRPALVELRASVGHYALRRLRTAAGATAGRMRAGAGIRTAAAPRKGDLS